MAVGRGDRKRERAADSIIDDRINLTYFQSHIRAHVRTIRARHGWTQVRRAEISNGFASGRGNTERENPISQNGLYAFARPENVERLLSIDVGTRRRARVRVQRKNKPIDTLPVHCNNYASTRIFDYGSATARITNSTWPSGPQRFSPAPGHADASEFT